MADAENVEVKVEKKKKRFPLVGVKSLLVLLVVLASLGTAFYFWQDAQDARQKTPEGVAARNAEDTRRVLGKVSSILFTKSDVEPTVARIENADVLRQANSDFYSEAQNGDYLILYPTRAIIFREAENRVINVAPIINTSQLGTQNTSDDTNQSDDTQTDQTQQ